MSAWLDVSCALKAPGQAFAFENAVTLESMTVLGDEVAFEDVHAQGEFIGAGEEISVKGEASATVHTRCVRCLEDVTLVLTASIDACYARETNSEDPDLYVFEGSRIDLTDAVRDALLLELPYRVLCSEDCKGLCSTCGMNLNLGTCTCQEGATRNNPFSALKAFTAHNEEV